VEAPFAPNPDPAADAAPPAGAPTISTGNTPLRLGTERPSPPVPDQRPAQVALWVAASLLTTLCGWLLFSDLHEVIGRRALLYGALFAGAPVLPMAAVFWGLNRLRPEPTRLLLITLAWGALIATYVALRLNGWLAADLGDRHGATARSAVFIAPWVEETCKAAVIFAIAWWRRHDFNGVVAGIVYGGVAGIGFAFTENVAYYGQLFQHVHDLNNDNGAAVAAVRSLFLWRGVAAPFIHPMFTMMTGIGIGIAASSRHVGVRILAPITGFCAAVLLHMGYNTAASFAVGKALTAVYLGMLVPTLLVVTLMVGALHNRRRRVLGARLRDYAASGWLGPDDVTAIITTRGRRLARRHAKAMGPQERRRVRAVQRTGVELAALRDQVVRGVAGKSEQPREAVLLSTLRHHLSRAPLRDRHDPDHDPHGAPSTW
jgi:RsiW-degrading membrane proteinase PrsW (M82 family)